MIRARGIIVPVEWSEDGIAVSFALSTFDEDEYVLESGLSREEMMALVREEVEVSGELRIERDKKTIAVSQISAKKRAAAG